MKIGIYPGSFDPIHLGHIKIVNKILEDKLVDKILFVPTGDYWNKNIVESLKDRIHMAKFFESNDIIIETKDNNIKATYDYIKQKEKEFPNAELSLIVGGDNIKNIDKWINSEELIKYPFIIIGRDNYDKSYIDSKLKTLNKSNYIVLNTENIDISSTDIRDSIKTGNIKKQVLDGQVYDYIIANNLYK